MITPEQYVTALQRALDDYKSKHPHWRLEVLVSLIEWSLQSLKHYIEDVRDNEINWHEPFVELHYGVDWNWEEPRDGDVKHSGLIYGHITEQNTADKATAVKTFAEIMACELSTSALGDFTSRAWFEIKKRYCMPNLPVKLVAALKAIKNKRERRKAFEQIVRPFSIGTMIDRGDWTSKEGASLPKKAADQMAYAGNPLGIRRIELDAEINGRPIEMSLVFVIEPLLANFDAKKAYFPITVGLFIEPRRVGNAMVTRTPARWPRKDRNELWRQLFEAVKKLIDQLIPKSAREDSIILKMNSLIKIPAESWQPQNRSAYMKRVMDALSQIAELEGFSMQPAGSGPVANGPVTCAVCGWKHDETFAEIRSGDGEPIRLRGRLTDIVRVVHQAHEKGSDKLSTKDDELLKICGGYKSPCKAFDGLKCGKEYQRLFDTRRRGFISLSGVAGRNRDKPESIPE